MGSVSTSGVQPDPGGALVRDVMTRKVVTVEAADTLQTAATVLARSKISGMPVVDKAGRVLGVLSEKDIVRVLQAETGLALPGGLFELVLETSEDRQRTLLSRISTVLHEVRVGSAMTAPARTIGPDALTLEAARLMLAFHINRMPVIDGGKLVGIVTRANVLAPYRGRE